jgi:CheY-like chemotaxis protein
MSILLVDDDSSVRRLLGFLLERSGYEVVSVGDGREAVEKAGKASVALIDMIMPEMDGLETISLLRWRNPHLRIIAMSGSEEGLFRPELDRLGVQTFLSKPFTIEALRAEIQAQLVCAQAA